MDSNIEDLIYKRRSAIRTYPSHTNDYWNHIKRLVPVIMEINEMGLEDNLAEGCTDPRIKKLIDFYQESPNNTPGASYNNPMTSASMQRFLNIVAEGFQPVESIPTDEEVNQFLEIIKKDVESMYVSSEEIAFIRKIVMYDPVTDSNVDFGRFSIGMARKKVIVKCHSGNTKIPDHGVYHPYVSSNGKLCLGDFLKPYEKFFHELNFLAAYDMVMEVLCNYGGNDRNGGAAGPHQNLVLWSGHACEDCGDIFKYDEGLSCTMTQKPMCPKCSESSKDEHTGKVYLSSLLEDCDACEKTTIDVKPFREAPEGVKLKWCSKCRFTNNKPVIPEPEPEPETNEVVEEESMVEETTEKESTKKSRKKVSTNE